MVKNLIEHSVFQKVWKWVLDKKEIAVKLHKFSLKFC